jgi:hypothetical protein
VWNQVVGDDVDNDVCERGGRRSGGDHEQDEPAGEGAHESAILQRPGLLRCRTTFGL